MRSTNPRGGAIRGGNVRSASNSSSLSGGAVSLRDYLDRSATYTGDEQRCRSRRSSGGEQQRLSSPAVPEGANVWLDEPPTT